MGVHPQCWGGGEGGAGAGSAVLKWGPGGVERAQDLGPAGEVSGTPKLIPCTCCQQLCRSRSHHSPHRASSTHAQTPQPGSAGCHHPTSVLPAGQGAPRLTITLERMEVAAAVTSLDPLAQGGYATPNTHHQNTATCVPPARGCWVTAAPQHQAGGAPGDGRTGIGGCTSPSMFSPPTLGQPPPGRGMRCLMAAGTGGGYTSQCGAPLVLHIPARKAL